MLGQSVERSCKLTDLAARRERRSTREISCCKRSSNIAQLYNGLCNCSRHERGDNNCGSRCEKSGEEQLAPARVRVFDQHCDDHQPHCKKSEDLESPCHCHCSAELPGRMREPN